MQLVEQAATHLKRAWNLGLQTRECGFLLGKSRLLAGRPAQAVDLLEVSAREGRTGARFLLAVAYLAAGRAQMALTLAEKEAAENPGHARTLAIVAISLRLLGDSHGAEAVWRRVIERAPRHPGFRFQLAILIIARAYEGARGETDDLLAEALELLTSHGRVPGTASSYLEACLRLELDDAQKAFEIFTAITDKRWASEVTLRRGVCLLRLGDRRRARHLFRELRRHHSLSSTARTLEKLKDDGLLLRSAVPLPSLEVMPTPQLDDLVSGARPRVEVGSFLSAWTANSTSESSTNSTRVEDEWPSSSSPSPYARAGGSGAIRRSRTAPSKAGTLISEDTMARITCLDLLAELERGTAPTTERTLLRRLERKTRVGSAAELDEVSHLVSPLESLLALKPDLGFARLYLARVRVLQNRMREAGELLRGIKGHSAERPKVLNLRARCAEHDRRPARALQLYRRSVHLSDDQPEIHYRAGRLSLQQHLTANASTVVSSVAPEGRAPSRSLLPPRRQDKFNAGFLHLSQHCMNVSSSRRCLLLTTPDRLPPGRQMGLEFARYLAGEEHRSVLIVDGQDIGKTLTQRTGCQAASGITDMLSDPEAHGENGSVGIPVFESGLRFLPRGRAPSVAGQPRALARALATLGRQFDDVVIIADDPLDDPTVGAWTSHVDVVVVAVVEGETHVDHMDRALDQLESWGARNIGVAMIE